MRGKSIDLSPREVAEFARVGQSAVNKAIEEKVLRTHVGARSTTVGAKNRAARMLGLEAVAYLALQSQIKTFALNRVGKRNLVRALQSQDPSRLHEAHVSIAPAIVVDVGALAGESLRRTRDYVEARDAWVRSVPGIMGGLPVVKGTRIPVYSIAARVAHGETIGEIASDFDLPKDACETALVYAHTHPLRARPKGAAG